MPLVRVLALWARVLSSRVCFSAGCQMGALVEGGVGLEWKGRHQRVRPRGAKATQEESASPPPFVPAGTRRAEPFLPLHTATSCTPKSSGGSLSALALSPECTFPTPGQSHSTLVPNPPRKHQEEGCPWQRVPGRSSRGGLQCPAGARGAQHERAQPGSAAIRQWLC